MATLSRSTKTLLFRSSPSPNFLFGHLNPPVRSQKPVRYLNQQLAIWGRRRAAECHGMLQRLIRAPFDHRFPGCRPSLLPQSRGHLLGSPRAAAAGRRAQTKKSGQLLAKHGQIADYGSRCGES
jgi:hypothetical protein